MRARNSYRTILGLCFVLLFGVAIAQQSQKYADAKYIAAGPPGWRVTGDDTLGGFSLNEGIAQPGTAGPVPHRHSREDELWYVLEGQLEFKIGERGEQIIVAGPGATVFGPRGIPHTFRAVGTTPARYLTFISPAGFEKFFAERIALGKEVPTTDPSYAARYKVLTDKYGGVQQRLVLSTHGEKLSNRASTNSLRKCIGTGDASFPRSRAVTSPALEQAP